MGEDEGPGKRLECPHIYYSKCSRGPSSQLCILVAGETENCKNKDSLYGSLKLSTCNSLVFNSKKVKRNNNIQNWHLCKNLKKAQDT